MLFNSYQFLLFFPVVTVLYFLLPHKFRWALLLGASCYFYMVFKPIYILILALTIVVDYYAGIWIENAEGSRRKLFLSLSIIANVGVLVFFKYYNFFVGNINEVFKLANSTTSIPLLDIILPIGLSFHTFQAMSYTIEVYRGNQKAEKHFGIYSLYVMFYPQLVAGPIERPQNMLHQFHEKHEFNYDDVVVGLRMALWGLFKKAVIADRLAVVTDPIFNHPNQYPAISILIGVTFFMFQIFCDFSGYSNIALGTARVMGYHLMVNFNWPYSAKSVSEFWRRWHISLSTWFNDYLFTPMSIAYRNIGIYAVVVASILTFLTSGLWHGAAWTYIVWGGLHGLALAYEVLTKKWRKKMYKKMPDWLVSTIGISFTCSWVWLSYIFFRANTLKDAFYIVSRIPEGIKEIFMLPKTGLSAIQLPSSPSKIGLCVLSVVILQSVYLIQKKQSLSTLLDKQSRPVRWGIYYAFALLIIYMGVFQNRQFIYFQF